MDETPPKPLGSKAPTREDRLAAKLRENLLRRKARARAQTGGPMAREPVGEPDGEPGGESPGLPKPPPER